VDYLRKRPVEGTPPKRTLIYGLTFDPKPADAKYTAARAEFIKMIGATALDGNGLNDPPGGLIRGTIDVRDIPTPKLEEYGKKLKAEGKANKTAVVSLGDEIGLAEPPTTEHIHAGFRQWLKSKGIKPSEADPAANDYDKIKYSATKETAKSNPR